MKVVFKDVQGQEERMLFIIILDDEGLEVKKYPIYLTKEAAEKLPVLQETFVDIKNLFEMIYNSGKNNEDIDFILESVNI